MLKCMVAKRSEHRQDRENDTGKSRHGLAASPYCLAWRGGHGFSGRFTAESLFKDPKRYYKQKAVETGMKEELVRGVATTGTCLHLGCS